MSVIRPLALDDAAVLADLCTASRAFLAPWEPERDESFYTEAGQAELIESSLAQHEQGLSAPQVILDTDGSVVGRITLNTIVRGAFQSCSLGYWVSHAHNGRGLATRAVEAAKDLAFGALELHRVEAATLLHNTASQTVLARNGFVRFGLAPTYLRIAGRWQDHVLFQTVRPAS